MKREIETSVLTAVLGILFNADASVFKRKKKKKSHEAAYMNRSLSRQHGDSTVGTSVSQHTGPNQNRTRVLMWVNEILKSLTSCLNKS